VTKDLIGDNGHTNGAATSVEAVFISAQPTG
jgi:hypothetical protein